MYSVQCTRVHVHWWKNERSEEQKQGKKQRSNDFIQNRLSNFLSLSFRFFWDCAWGLLLLILILAFVHAFFYFYFYSQVFSLHRFTYVCMNDCKCNVYMHSMIHLMFCHSLNKLNENSLRCCVMERKTYIFVNCGCLSYVLWAFVLFYALTHQLEIPFFFHVLMWNVPTNALAFLTQRVLDKHCNRSKCVLRRIQYEIIVFF